MCHLHSEHGKTRCRFGEPAEAQPSVALVWPKARAIPEAARKTSLSALVPVGGPRLRANLVVVGHQGGATWGASSRQLLRGNFSNAEPPSISSIQLVWSFHMVHGCGATSSWDQWALSCTTAPTLSASSTTKQYMYIVSTEGNYHPPIDVYIFIFYSISYIFIDI